MVLPEKLLLHIFVTKSHDPFCRMPSVDQFISFQLTNHCKTLLKLHLLRKTNVDLYNDYIKNLIDSYIINFHLIERHLLGHEFPFQ